MGEGQSYLVRRIREGHAALFGQTWPLWLAGVLVAFLSILMFAWERPWGVVAGLRNWGDWLFTSLGVYRKPIDSPLTSYESLMVIGLILGAFASALLGREFSVRVPPRMEVVKGLVAGLLMGIGSALARGCNVGGFFETLGSLSLGGVAMAFGLIPGVYVGLRYLLWELEKFPSKSAASPSKGKEGGLDWRVIQTWLGYGVLLVPSLKRILISPRWVIQPWLGYGVLLAGIAAAFQYSALAYSRTGGVLLLSMAIGLVFHRSRFCFVAAFRDPFMTGESRQTKAMLLSLMIVVVGYSLLKWSGLRPESAYVVNTFALGGLVGGFIFGAGMVVAGGCGSGTLWRVGEGQVKLWVVMAVFAMTNALARFYLETTGLVEKLGRAIFLPDLLTYRWSVIAVLAFLALWYIAADWNEEKETFVVG